MKKKLRRLLFISILAHLHISTFAQDSSHIRISLITCTPGEELYSTFGHSAFRIVDSSKAFNDNQRDVVYNYGTFDFDESGFYIKFMRGKLLYYVSAENFTDFKDLYQTTARGITEQVLHLSAGEKISMQQFLNNNLKKENRHYKYDFFFDNCTTRLRDILKQQHDSAFCKINVMPKGTRFRQAIHQYLDNNNKHWSKLGIDILLGWPCDAVMTAEQMQFLPDNLMLSLDSSKNMIDGKQSLYPFTPQKSDNIFTPLFVFWLLFAVIVLLGFVKSKWAINFINRFTGLYFFMVGLLGVLLIIMWFATDHSMTKSNFNLLWAWPTHTVAAFFISSKKLWVKRYFSITAVGMLLVLLAWFFLPQQMNNALLPLVLLQVYLAVRKLFQQ